mmetsp:Transcript_106406/g.297974  ORF Transcript_106406/g.297974 Transcript_106406/m.297974 type:complete len:383 (-) Transcript_106406:255-1403(-)
MFDELRHGSSAGALDNPQAPEVDLPWHADGVSSTPCRGGAPDSAVGPTLQLEPGHLEASAPPSRQCTWVHVATLPEDEGDDLPMDPEDRRSFDIEAAKRWCESNAHCVGFAHWADKRNVFHFDGWIYPKERSTGFDERTCSWASEKYEGEVWHWYYIKERARSSEAGQAVSKPRSKTTLINGDARYEPLSKEAVPSYLADRGYAALDTLTWALVGPSEWENRMPVVAFSVTRHEEAGAHTWYTVEAELAAIDGSARQRWKAPRRLLHMRQFHDYLKQLLSADGYDRIFSSCAGGRVPFASRGGMPGTTSKLHTWLCALANAVNDGRTTPAVVAATLHFLRAPVLLDDGGGNSGEEDLDLSRARVALDSSPAVLGSPHPHQLE